MKQKKAVITHYIIIAFIGLFLLIVLVTNMYLAKEHSLEKSFYPNIFIDDIYVVGHTKDEINAIFQSRNAKLDKIHLNIVYNNEPIATLSAKQINLHSNGQDIAERAFLIGRTPHDTSRVLQKISTIFYLR